MRTDFWKYYVGMFHKPASTFEAVFQSDKALRYACFALLIPAVGYSLFYAMAWHAGGSPSTFKPWLNIPMEHYFKYDVILAYPGYYLSWVGASVTVYLLSRLQHGQGQFDHLLAVTGFGVGVATWSSLLHDLTDALLSVLGVIDMRTYERLLNEPTFWRGLLWTLYTLYLFWTLTLFTIGIRKAQGFTLFRSIVLAVVGFVTFQVILLIFIR